MARNLPSDGDRAAFLADKQPLFDALRAIEDPDGATEPRP